MITEIQYSADGRAMVGVLAVPNGQGPFPGVLIAHEGNGLDEFQKQRTQLFADAGYAAFSLDYYGGGVPLSDRSEINRRLTELIDDPLRTRAIAQEGLSRLLEDPRVDSSRIVSVGYCFGGTMVIELARSGAPILATVGLHPGLYSSRPEDSKNISGKVLVCVGAEDPIVTLDQRTAFESEMTSAGVDWQVHVYGGVKHSFTHPRAGLEVLPGLEYHALADRRSWTSMMELFAEVTGAGAN